MSTLSRSPYILVASTEDQAGSTLANTIMSLGNFVQDSVQGDGISYVSKNVENAMLHLSSKSVLGMDDLDIFYPYARSFIFLSKHKSDSAIPALTCHTTGNFSENLYGGKHRELGIAYPSFQKAYMHKLMQKRKQVSDYEIIIEATHHGPTSLKKPSVFIELGSSELQWSDTNAADVICSCIIDLIQNGFSAYEQVGIGLGGTHYPAKFNDLLLNSNIALGTIASKYNLEAVDEDMLRQMVSKSAEAVSKAFIDSKGLGKQKDRILDLVRGAGLDISML